MAFLQLVSVSGEAAELRQHFKQFQNPIYTRAAGVCVAVLVRARFTGSSIAAELRQHFKQFQNPLYTRAAGVCVAVLVRARFTGSSIAGVTQNAGFGGALSFAPKRSSDRTLFS